VKDFAPITGLGKGGQVLVVKADYLTNRRRPAGQARKEPAKLSFGTAVRRAAWRATLQATEPTTSSRALQKQPGRGHRPDGARSTMIDTDTATGCRIRAASCRALACDRQAHSCCPMCDTSTSRREGLRHGLWFAGLMCGKTPRRSFLACELRRPVTKGAAAKRSTTTPGPKLDYPTRRTRQFQLAGPKWGKVSKAAGSSPE